MTVRNPTKKALASVNVKRRHWFYSGDINIEHGGVFYNLDPFEDGYVDAVRLQPCSAAGGPDNCYWIEHLSISIHDGWKHAFYGVGDTAAERRAHRVLHDMPDAERTESAMQCIGYDSPEMLADWDKRTLAERKHIIVYACIIYGHYDTESNEMISIGKPEFTRNREGDWKPAQVLRSTTNLRKYVRGKCT